MKDQYVGDIGDFGKYSLLRAFTDAGVKVGVNCNKTKSVMDIQKSGILTGAVYYSALLSPKGTPSERREERQRWFEKSETVFKDSELIFMDPDNGLLEKNDPSALSADITLDRSDGSSVTVSKRVDGNLEIKTSSNPGTSVVIS